MLMKIPTKNPIEAATASHSGKRSPQNEINPIKRTNETNATVLRRSSIG
jgi:hypothetical protein